MDVNEVNQPEAIFLTGRFRSGTTALWNIFRHVPLCRAYYEPLNDLLPVYLRHGLPVSDGHRGVDTYWAEYADLRDHVIHLHRTDFAWRKLLLESDDDFPELERYLQFLIDSAAGEVPVMKFCRADFRLPWLRARFPRARIIHIRRDPRREWSSMTRGLAEADAFDRRTNTDYDLLLWAMALAGSLGVLCRDEVASSYHRHYLLWRLSDVMGRRCADRTIDLDAELSADPQAAIAAILEAAELTGVDADSLTRWVKPPKPASAAALPWGQSFEAIEAQCDRWLDRLGLLDAFGVKPLGRIRARRIRRWRKLSDCRADPAALEAMAGLFIRARSDAAELSHSRQESLRNAPNPA